ncbi:MAG: hypothetical protein ACI8QC_003252 [Planctomycetota bacterium]|jgi:hypothetical protein
MLLLGYRRANPDRRGAALLLAFLVLMVILMITYQITRSTSTDQIETRRSLVFTGMDLAIESAFLQIAEDLAADGDAGGAAEDSEDGPPLPPLGGEGEGEGGEPESTDSQMDEWATPSATTIGGLDLRILIEDENRKFNILGMLAEDEEEAQTAFDIVVRILDQAREGTLADIASGEAEVMARVMRDHMLSRDNTMLPSPLLLSAGPVEEQEAGAPVLPMSLREFLVLEPFEPHHFRDLFDENGDRVHSIGSFLTMYTSPTDGGGTPEGGWAVNVNTAPLAVLMSLFDTRVVDSRVWDEVLLYRNDEEELGPDDEEVEPTLDEFGNEVIVKRIFDDLEELDEVYDFEALEAEVKAEVLERLQVNSDVFSVTITSRMATSNQDQGSEGFNTRREREEYERDGTHLVRTVRRIYWRVSSEEESSMVILVNWEVLDYSPLEVLDFPDADF